MNFISWILGLSLLIFLVIQGTRYHHALVCRQEAWLLALEMRTESLLTKKEVLRPKFLLRCGSTFSLSQDQVSWRKFPSLKTHHLELKLMGKL